MKTIFSLLLFFFLLNDVFGQEVLNRKVVQGISAEKTTEFAPSLSADGKTMIFQSDAGSGWGLYESKMNEDGNWSDPFPLKDINEKCDFLAGPSLSYDGNTLYYTAFIEGETESEDIFYSTRIGEKKWSEPINIGAPINTDDDYEGFPSVSSDGNSLYFIRFNFDNPRDRKSKEDCFTIYVSHKRQDGSWGEPEKLPPHINSGCERDPKIMADNHTLIFSSIREGGKGKYDMYQSRLQADGAWGAVSPMNFVNSADNDQSPGISASGDKMYFYSKNDIYEVEIPMEYRQMINITVQGFVKSLADNKAVPVKIYLTDVNTNEVVSILENNASDGKYSIIMQGGESYKAVFSNPEYFSDSIMLDFSDVETYKELKQDFLLKSVYTLKFSVKDKDLDKNLNAMLSIIDANGNLTFEDSLFVKQMPYDIPMSTLTNYKLKVNVSGYPEWETMIRFDADKFKEETYYIAEIPFEKVKFNANVTDVVSKSKMKMKVYFKNEDEDELLIVDSGEEVFLRKGNRYEVMTSSDKGYVYSSVSVTAGEGTPDQYGNYSLELEVLPVQKGMSLSLNHIVFDFNSAELDSISAFELNRIIELLIKNDNINIEIGAHTDDVGNEQYNLKLSEKRAQSVVRYLVNNNIDAKRLSARGYGMSVPLFPNDSDENRAKNRRVELIILDVNEN